MGEGINRISEKINSFKRRYYLNLLIRGSILTLSATLAYFILASIIEYNLWLGRGARFIIFTSFFILVGWCVYRFLREPLAWWIYRKGLGEEESAKLIGKFFPGVADRLLNTIQLLSSHPHSALIDAGVAQKSELFKDVRFETAIDLNENKRYLKYLFIPLALIILLLVINQGIFTQSTSRIVKFNQEFTPQAPFQFMVENQSMLAFFNEDFTLSVHLVGDAIPDAAYVVLGPQRWKMESLGEGKFSYTFEKIQNSLDLQIEASGFLSEIFKITMVSRPELTQLKVNLDFPKYLNQKSSELINAGNLEIPEGTIVTWKIQAANTVEALFKFSSEASPNQMQQFDNESFHFTKNVKDPDQYSILLENEKSKNKDQITYSIEVIKDQFPQIVVENLRDSILYSGIVVGGTIRDDHGLTSLKLHYQIQRDGKELPLSSLFIPINSNQPQQNFYFSWDLDSLSLQPGDKLNYHFQVWDNDGVNGRKSTRSANYVFTLPGKEELVTEISESERSAESKIEEGINKAKDLRESIEEAQQKLRGKQTLDWQDKKMLEDLIKQKEKLNQQLDALQKENELLEKKKESFTEQSERIREKSEQIRKLMEELLDEETKKMFEELEKLLKENADAAQMQKLLEKMDRKEINLEKELERTLELFKQLQYDYKLDQAVNQLKEQTEKQEQLLSKTEELLKEQSEKNNKTENDSENSNRSNELSKEQEDLQKEFEQFEKSLDELEKLGEELNKEDISPDEEEKQGVKNSQEQSKEELKNNNPKKSKEQQQKSVQQMKNMAQKMEEMSSSMEMEMDMANMESLRQILHGLIKLSFDEERMMKEFAAVQQTDPRYVVLSQQQLKIKDDVKVLEDSLLSLSKKDMFLNSVVTKEIGELNDHIEKAVEHVKERRKTNATSEMQFTMASMNNLALMLNDHYNMMMDMMANAKPGKGKKKGKMEMQPNLGNMQEMLNRQMEEIRKGGKSGRQLSEEFAKMAAEQERIRRALQEMQEMMKEQGGQIPGGDLPGKMEQTEMDLVNKQITEQTIRRQKEILTRLLDAEKSMREQDFDEERKGETAKDRNKDIPKEFEDYLRMKEKEIELLKTMPPKLYPYYKREVNEYFKRIGTTQQ